MIIWNISIAIEQLIKLETREPSILHDNEEANLQESETNSKFPKKKSLKIPRKQGLSKSDSYSLLPSAIPEEEPLPIPDNFVIPIKRSKTLNVKPALFLSTDSGRNRRTREKSPTRFGKSPPNTEKSPPRFEKSPPRFEKSPPMSRNTPKKSPEIISKQVSESHLPPRKSRFFGGLGNKGKEIESKTTSVELELPVPEEIPFPDNIPFPEESLKTPMTPLYSSYSTNDLTAMDQTPTTPAAFNLDIPTVSNLNKLQIHISGSEEEDIFQSTPSTIKTSENQETAKNSEKEEDNGEKVEGSADKAHACVKALNKFRKFNIPAKGERVSFSVSRYLNPLIFTRPFYGNEEFELFSEWSIPVTFFFTSFENMCTLISALLLEKKVIIVSPNLRVLSAVVYFFPFNFYQFFFTIYLLYFNLIKFIFFLILNNYILFTYSFPFYLD